MEIALVGFTRSYNDLRWLEMASVWMGEHEPSMPWADATQTIFDLRGESGRNFLDDRGEFDAVVLFAIYNPLIESAELRKALGRRRGQTSLALNHSRESWVNRLTLTKAKYLFIFRRDNSVNGQWLGKIDQYDLSVEKPGVFGVSIYVHQQQAQPQG